MSRPFHLPLILLLALGAVVARHWPGAAFDPPPVPAVPRIMLFAAAARADGGYLVLGDHGTVLTLDPAGRLQPPPALSEARSLLDFCWTSTRGGWGAGSGGLLAATTDGGRSWTRSQAPVGRHLFAVAFGDARHGCAVGDWGRIVTTADGGATWRDASLGEDVILYDVAFCDAQNACAVGEMGRIFASADAGATWQEVTSGVDTTLFCIAAGPRGLAAAGLDGTLIASSDRGLTWSVQPSGTDRSLYAIAFAGAEGWAVGDAGCVIHSGDGGATWNAAPRPAGMSPRTLTAVALAPDSRAGLIAGEAGTVWIIREGRLEAPRQPAPVGRKP